MDWTQRLNAALDYLEEQLASEFDIETAAGLANCSAFHFMRMFEVVFGMPVGEYVRRRRLSCAAIELAAGRNKVIDVALRYGYESPESFSKAFRKLFDISPSQARTPGVRLTTWPPVRLAVVLKGSEIMKYRIEERKSIKLTGISLRTSSVGEANMKAIPAFWDECHAKGYPALMAKHSGPLGMLGVCHDYNAKDSTFSYLIAIEDPGTPIPGMEGKLQPLVLAPATYAVFESVGPMPLAIQDVWKRIYSEWFPSSGYEHAGTPDFEVYPNFTDSRGDPSSPDCYSEVWIPIKKKP